MSIIERAATQAGIELDRDVPKPGSRRCRDWAKLIGTARKLEAQETQEREEMHGRIHELEKRNRELMEETFRLREKLRDFIVSQRMREIELPEADQKRLLAPSA